MNPLRWHCSCPDCGFVLSDHDCEVAFGHTSFDCPRCKTHYTKEDFHNEQNEKHMAQHHNHAKADLTNEES